MWLMLIRKSPCERYLRYLLLHPDGYSNTAILSLCERLHLDPITSTYVEEIRTHLNVPVGFNPTTKSHRASHRYLMMNGLYFLFYPDAATDEAFDILDKEQAKEIVETMLICRDPIALIARRLQSAGFGQSVQGVERYASYFFDVSSLSTPEMRTLMRMRYTPISPPIGTEDELVRTASTLSMFQDPRIMLTGMASHQLASILNQMRMGYSPQMLELSKAVKSARDAAIIRAMDTLLHGGPKDAENGKDLVSMAMALTEMMNNIGSPSEDLRKDLQLLHLNTDQSQIPLLSSLSGGDHTVDLQKHPVPIQTFGEEQ